MNASTITMEAASKLQVARLPSTQPQNSKMMGKPRWLLLRRPPLAKATSPTTAHSPQTST